MAAKIVEAIKEDKGHLVLAYIVDAMSDVDPKLLDELEDQINQCRLSIRKPGNAY